MGEFITVEDQKAIDAFLAKWDNSDSGIKEAFLELYRFVHSLPQTMLRFSPRPGISYSLRIHPTGEDAKSNDIPLALIDVIDEQPRWISACFAAESITDPESLGDLIPGGLLGKDGYCFDITTSDSGIVAYIKERIVEASSNVAHQHNT